MKKRIVFAVALALVLLMSSCSTSGTNEDVLLKELPALTVSCGESSIEALRGAASWWYSGTAIEADSIHPLQAKEYMTPLLLPSTDSYTDPLTARLSFDAAPDEVSVRCWSEECWEQVGAESEAVDISDDNDGSQGPVFTVSLKDGVYIYEITAEWNRSDQYGGTVHYSFYTTPGSTESSVSVIKSARMDLQR